jgi:hypothetical protein
VFVGKKDFISILTKCQQDNHCFEAVILIFNSVYNPDDATGFSTMRSTGPAPHTLLKKFPAGGSLWLI